MCTKLLFRLDVFINRSKRKGKDLFDKWTFTTTNLPSEIIVTYAWYTVPIQTYFQAMTGISISKT